MASVLRVGLVGAGAIHFGQPGKPWGHARKLENIGGVSFVGIVDVDTVKAESALRNRRDTEFAHLYDDCKIFDNYKQLIAIGPDIAFIGIPAGTRGSLYGDKDIALQFVKAGIHVFVEKPLSLSTPDEFQKYNDVINAEVKKHDVIVSVGYMLRYHPAVDKMKEMIKLHGGKVMAFNARFYMAYTDIDRSWFERGAGNVGGPVGEHLSHFLDLARYITDSEIEIPSILSSTVAGTDSAGYLSHLSPGCEDDTPPEQMMPRVTVAQFRFRDAGIGTVMHSTALPGSRYETCVEIHLDALSFSFRDQYGERPCELRIRSLQNGTPNEDEVYTYDTFGKDDMYRRELEVFLEAVKSNDPSLIRSSYDDAAKTQRVVYELENFRNTCTN